MLSKTRLIDRMPKWQPKKYSFVFVSIRPSSLVLEELFFRILSVLVRLISTKKKEYFLAAIYAFGLLKEQKKFLRFVACEARVPVIVNLLRDDCACKEDVTLRHEFTSGAT